MPTPNQHSDDGWDKIAKVAASNVAARLRAGRSFDDSAAIDRFVQSEVDAWKKAVPGGVTPDSEEYGRKEIHGAVNDCVAQWKREVDGQTPQSTPNDDQPQALGASVPVQTATSPSPVAQQNAAPPPPMASTSFGWIKGSLGGGILACGAMFLLGMPFFSLAGMVLLAGGMLAGALLSGGETAAPQPQQPGNPNALIKQSLAPANEHSSSVREREKSPELEAARPASQPAASPAASVPQAWQQLHTLVKDGALPSIKEWMERERRPDELFDITNPDTGWNAAHVAAAFGRDEILSYIQSRYPAAVDRRDHQRRRPADIVRETSPRAPMCVSSTQFPLQSEEISRTPVRRRLDSTLHPYSPPGFQRTL